MPLASEASRLVPVVRPSVTTKNRTFLSRGLTSLIRWHMSWTGEFSSSAPNFPDIAFLKKLNRRLSAASTSGFPTLSGGVLCVWIDTMRSRLSPLPETEYALTSSPLDLWKQTSASSISPASER
jgi:hypothetical protein